MSDKGRSLSMTEQTEEYRYARNLLVHFVEEHFPHNPNWRPLPDLIGVLTQIDNAITIARDYKARIVEMERPLKWTVSNPDAHSGNRAKFVEDAPARPGHAQCPGQPAAWRTMNDHGHWHYTDNPVLANTWIKAEKLDVQPLYLGSPDTSTDRTLGEGK